MMQKAIGGIALAAVLIMLSGCSGANLDSVGFDAASLTNQGPALIAHEDENTVDPPEFSGASKDSPDDLVSMTAEEETGYSLFCSRMSETQYRFMLENDGVDFVPDHMTVLEKQYYAYYSSTAHDLVVCTVSLDQFDSAFSGTIVSDDARIMDVQWMDADHLVILAGNETMQSVYVYHPAAHTMENIYTSPSDKTILSMSMGQNGVVNCEVAGRQTAESGQTAQPGAVTAEDGNTSKMQQDAPPTENPGNQASAPTYGSSETIKITIE